MASADIHDQPAEVASKVLHRAQVSKLTRTVQNRLALATVKIQHGWATLPLESIEPRIEQELKKRKRPTSSSNGAYSDTSSSAGDHIFPSRPINSSPLTAPLFSDQLPHSGSSRGSKRQRHTSMYQSAKVLSDTAKIQLPPTRSHTWKRSHRLAESSPAFRRYTNGPLVARPRDLSISHDNLADDLSLPSEEDDSDLPLQSFQVSARQIRSSPPRIPRTPSPKPRNKTFNNPRSEDAADLLMFLAASPSPAIPNNKSRNMNPPSTPPQKTPLPSSMLSTPGGGSNFIGFGTTTPGMAFNFSDYLNVTPSPAQAAWRTPGLNRTPLAAREARKRLNFDRQGSPDLPTAASSKVTGLGMELGGELISK